MSKIGRLVDRLLGRDPDRCRHWWEWGDRLQGTTVIRFPDSDTWIERHVAIEKCVLCGVRLAWAPRVPKGATLADGTPVLDKSGGW